MIPANLPGSCEEGVDSWHVRLRSRRRFLTVNPDPKVVGEHGLGGADLDPLGVEGGGSGFGLRLAGGQHARMDEAQVWRFAIFIAIVARRPLDFGLKISLLIIIEP